ncbi:MAG TPA: hypothetical protein VGB14_11415 [Acidimicrobiales bacterium]
MALHCVTTDGPPADPVGAAVADALSELLVGASVDLTYAPPGAAPGPASPPTPGVAAATDDGPDGWRVTLTVRLDDRLAHLVRPSRWSSLTELLEVIAPAGLRAAARLRPSASTGEPLVPALHRALRDTVAAEVLAAYLASRVGAPDAATLVAEIVEFLVELSGTRVEAHDVTHGVVVADVLHDTPRIELHYPVDVRAAKRAPLLFDGQRSVLVVDPQGRARTELQRHRFQRLAPGAPPPTSGEGLVGSGSLVADATRALGGVGFFVRADRSVWTFVDGQPLLVRRGEHWTAFPLELSAWIADMIGGGDVAALVARTAFVVSALPSGAILAITGDAARLEGAVSPKDRYDLRHEIDPEAMRPETRLHHLIDAADLDEQTLTRLAVLDGATVLDRHGRLLAYGAIVTSNDSQHEGARTAAARTLSETADVVLKVSVDGDITIFRAGAEVTTLLGRPR